MNRSAPRSSRQRLLIVAPFIYGRGAGNGGGAISHVQMQQLSAEFDLGFVSFTGVEAPEVERAEMASVSSICSYVGTEALRINKPAVLRARLSSLGLRFPELASLCRSGGMQTRITQAIRDFTPDLVWIQFPQMAQYVENCGGIPCVMDVQDAYTLSGFRGAQRAQGARSLRSWLDWVCWARYEARYYPKFSAVLTLSEQDAGVLSAFSPAMRAQSMGLPLGTGAVPVAQAEPMRVGFAGAFGHRPNVEGLRWFVDEVWPLVLAKAPAARLVVAGRNPPDALIQSGDVSIQFVGYVPDISEFYASNMVTVVPLVSGGGVKIKTVEAMLAGSAIVSTRIGVEGTGVVAGTHALVADDPAGFASAVVLGLTDPQLRNSLASAARGLSNLAFSANAWRRRVSGILGEVIGHHEPA